MNQVRQKIKETETRNKKKQLLQPIQRNSNGIPVIKCTNIGEVVETLVDEDDYYDLIQYTWCVDQQGYASAKINGIQTLMHRHVLKYNGPLVVDHILRIRLDNRKDQLRIITPPQNAMNKTSAKGSSSKYLGVSFSKVMNKWCSYITKDGKKIHLGYYDSDIDAARARDVATKKYFKEFGSLNFPNENIIIAPKPNVRVTSSKHVGVSLDKSANNWLANIYVNNKTLYLGRFKTENDALKARQIALEKQSKNV